MPRDPSTGEEHGTEVSLWGKPGTPAGRTNYDTLNGGPPISSINGATEKGQDGYHDPYQAPPAGFKDWHEVGESNKNSLEAAALRTTALERAGFKYNKGTWTAPDGRTTTLFAIDPGPPGGVDYHWDAGQENDPYAQPQSERQQYEDVYSQDPRRQYDIEGEVENEGEMTRAFSKYTIWGRLLTAIQKWSSK
jgi:hypothetical protein